MALFHKRKVEARSEQVIDDINLSAQLARALLGGETMTKEMALQIPEVESCISLIAGIVSSLPIKLYKKENGKVEEITEDTRLKLLNDDPGDTLQAQQMWRAIIEDYYLGKGGFIYIAEDSTLRYVDETAITLNKSVDKIYKSFTIMVDGKELYPFQFIRFLRKTRDGAESNSVIKENSLMLSVAYASLILEKSMTKRGGKKSGFMESEKQLTKEAMTMLKEAWRDVYSGDSDNCMVLNNGIKFKETSNTAVEMQISERKKANSPKLTMLFNVPIALIDGTGTNQDYANLIKMCISPLLCDFESSLDRDFLKERQKEAGWYYSYDITELTRGSIKERMEAYGVAIDKNIMQIDEVRAKEDLPSLGFNYIKLGLDTVLLDPRTGTVYTPNTNQTTVIGEKGDEKNV